MWIIIKLKFKSNGFRSSNKSTFYNFVFFLIFIFIYIKISQNLSAKYYQENKERLQKKLVKDIEKKKSNKGPLIKYVPNKSPKFWPPLPPVRTCTLSSTSFPPAYIRTFNTVHYLLLITQNRKALENSKFLECF